jgi:hypothetical protein
MSALYLRGWDFSLKWCKAKILKEARKMKKSVILILLLSIAIVSFSSAQLRRMEKDTENKFPKVPLATGKTVISTAPFDSAIKSDEAAISLAKVKTKTGQILLAGAEDENKRFTRAVFKSKNIYIGPGSLTAKAFFDLPKDDVFFNSKAAPKVKLTILNEAKKPVIENLFPISEDDILQKGPKEFAISADNLSDGHYYAEVIIFVECMPGGVFAIGGESKLLKIELIPEQK